MEQMANRTIVIIGGTTGLGLSGAKALVAEGAKVIVVGRNEDSAAAAGQALGEKNAAILVADAIDAQTAPRAIQLALDHFGRFDGLYHVAGGSGRAKGDGPLHQISEEGIHYTIDLNLKSVLYSNRAAVRQFLEQKTGGAILNMGSVLGWSPSPKHFATHVYSATRGGVMALTKAAAAYYAPYNIRFNVIAPALVETPMSQRAVSDPAIREFIQYKQPLDGGRIGVTSDLDAAVVFFLSDASKYVTGQVLAVDGGWTVSEGTPRTVIG
jgi:NAD(P)-dependent dehydrogenase (short-subunit alcohol dehydrogenase family)